MESKRFEHAVLVDDLDGNHLTRVHGLAKLSTQIDCICAVRQVQLVVHVVDNQLFSHELNLLDQPPFCGGFSNYEGGRQWLL